jgi:PAS domain S-box-containing protein
LYSTAAHGALWWWTGDRVWVLVAALSIVHALVIVPLTARFMDSRLITVVDGISMFVATMIVGDPIVLTMWASTMVMSTIVFLSGRYAVVTMMVSVGLVLMAYAAHWSGLIDGRLDPQVGRVYGLVGTGAWGLVGGAYVASVGVAVKRREAELNRERKVREEAEAQAAKRADQLRRLLDSAPVGFAFQDREGRFLVANDRLAEMFDLPVDHILRHGVIDAIDPDDAGWVEEAVTTARQNRLPVRIEHPVRWRDGSRHWLALDSQWFPLEDGSDGHVSVLRDMTAEKQATVRSRRFAAALERVGDLVVLWDAAGTVRHANRAFQAFWTAGEDPAGQALSAVVGEEVTRTWEALAGDAGRVAEMEVAAPDGRAVQLSIVVVTVRDETSGDRIHTAVARNITEAVEARRQLELLIRSKDEFIASVSHELRTPLAVVVGLAAEMADTDQVFSPGEVAEFTRLIAEQSADVAALVEDLLMAARADAGMLVVSEDVIDLDTEVAGALRSLPLDFSRRVSREGVDQVKVTGDPVRVRQIIRNLLTNAKRYGGPRVHLVTAADDAFGYVRVIDDGDPIALDTRERMFEPYERAHATVGTPDSVGLGLTVSRRLARMMGGDVGYRHEDGLSTFELRLPLA